MKATAKVYSTLLFTMALMLTNSARASDDPLVEKKKTYSKTYAVSANDRISLSNSFGEMKINTWDKNEVKVDVTITGKANTDDRAQEILDRISIDDGRDGKGVYFKTKTGDHKNQKWDKGDKQGFSIDYTVFLPAGNTLEATNEFGPMSIGDYRGSVHLVSKFGSLSAGKLNNAKKVEVEFGKLTMAAMKGGELVIKFSRGLVHNLEGTVKARFEHSGVKIVFDNNLKELTIKNEFTQLYLDASTGLSASFTVHTNFSELRNKSNFTIKEEGEEEDRRGPKFDHDYSGKAGTGATPIKIKSEFGDVILGHNLEFDVNKDDKKEKDKKNTRAV